MNFRKITAVLAAVLMLCTILPMGALSVSAADALYSWDFEDGDLTGWASGSAAHALVAAADLPVANANGGNYAMSTTDTYYGYTNYDIALEKNTDYLLTFSILSGTKNYPLNVRGRLSNSDLFKNEITPSTTKWETYSFVFNSGNYTSIGLRFQHGWEGSTFYLDNISVEVYNPSNLGSTDGFINNGDFETGDASAWGSTSNTAVVADPTGAGQGYVMSTNETESGVTMFNQTARNMKANTYYKLSFKVYGNASATNSAFWVRFPKTVTDWTVDLGTSGYSSQSANDYTPRINIGSKTGAWNDISITFYTGDLTEVFINFMNYRASYGQYYFDDIKLTEMKTPSFDGYITNGDFETGDLTGWTITAANIAEEDGNYVLQGTNATKYKNFVHQIVDVEANTEYAIRFKAKSGDSDGGQARVYAGTGTGNTGALNSTYSFTVKTDVWGTYTTTFNSGENTQVYVNLCQGITDGGDVYYDDVMMWEVKEASFDGYLYNGDFETGVGGTWKFSQSTAGVESFAAYNGTFGANLQGNGGWGGLMSASFTTEAGATYQLTFWYKAISRGVNFSIKDTDNNGEKLKSGYYSKTEWTQVTLEFTALSSTTYINFNGPGTEANGAEQVYVDDMVVTLIAPAHTCEIVELERVEADCENDGYVKYGCECGEGVYTETIDAIGHAYAESARTDATCGADGSVTYTCGNCGGSYDETLTATGAHAYDHDYDEECNVCGGIREVEIAVSAVGTSASEDVSGLAFLFSTEAEGITAVIGEVEADYTNATMGGYKLISMGAKVSNAKSEKVIEAKWLYELTDASASYAVRVINIPAANLGDEITAIPYYVVEIDGEQVTIEGEAQVDTYNNKIG